MSKFETVPDEKRLNRREFLKKAGRGALALLAANMISGCMPEKDSSNEEPFSNKEYLELEQEFITEGFSDSKVFREFKATYGQKSFKEFKEKYKLSDEEADRRWSSSILRNRNTFLDRARNWKKVNKINKDAKSYEMVNGQVESIDGKSVPKKSNENASDNKKSAPLESIKIDTSAY